MSTVTSSPDFRRTEKALTSRHPSPFGEKNRPLKSRSWTTGGEPLRRWATKNAAKVAPTSTAKVTRATQLTRASARLVATDDDDHVGVPPARLGERRDLRAHGLRR